LEWLQSTIKLTQ